MVDRCPVPAPMSGPDPMRSLALILTVLPLQALAETPLPETPLPETPLTAAEFESHVLGKTVTYADSAGVYGIEEYLTDHMVRWSVAPELCQYGTWYPEGDNICFVYEDAPDPSCWTFWLRGNALTALQVNAPLGSELHEVAANDQGLPCPGPDVGV